MGTRAKRSPNSSSATSATRTRADRAAAPDPRGCRAHRRAPASATAPSGSPPRRSGRATRRTIRSQTRGEGLHGVTCLQLLHRSPAIHGGDPRSGNQPVGQNRAARPHIAKITRSPLTRLLARVQPCGRKRSSKGATRQYRDTAPERWTVAAVERALDEPSKRYPKRPISSAQSFATSSASSALNTAASPAGDPRHRRAAAGSGEPRWASNEVRSASRCSSRA